MPEEPQMPSDSEKKATDPGSDAYQSPSESPAPPPPGFGVPPSGYGPPPPGYYPPPPPHMGPPPGYGPPPPYPHPRPMRPHASNTNTPPTKPSTDKPFRETLPVDGSSHQAQNSYEFSKPADNGKRASRRSKGSFWAAVKIAGVSGIMLALVTLTAISMIRWYSNLNTTGTVQTVDTSDATSIIDRYMDANSGLRYLEGIKSVSLRGKMTVDGESFDFVEIRKRPQQFWFKKERKNESEIYAFNADEAWSKFHAASGNETLKTSSANESLALRSENSLINPLLDYALSGRKDAQLVKSSENVFTIKINDLGLNEEVLVFIDQKTFQIKSLELLLQDGSRIQHVYFDHTHVDGVWLPFKIERYSKGQPTQRFFVEKAVINPGVMSSLFRMPRE